MKMPPPHLLLPTHSNHRLPSRIQTIHLTPIPHRNIRRNGINLTRQIVFQLPQRFNNPIAIRTPMSEPRPVVRSDLGDEPVVAWDVLAQVGHADGGADLAEIVG